MHTNPYRTVLVFVLAASLLTCFVAFGPLASSSRIAAAVTQTGLPAPSAKASEAPLLAAGSTSLRLGVAPPVAPIAKAPNRLSELHLTGPQAAPKLGSIRVHTTADPLPGPNPKSGEPASDPPQVWISYRLLGDLEPTIAAPRFPTIDELEPGKYEVSAFTGHHEANVKLVEVRPGQVSELRMHLDGPVQTQQLSLEILSDSPISFDGIMVSFRARGDGSIQFMATNESLPNFFCSPSTVDPTTHASYRWVETAKGLQASLAFDSVRKRDDWVVQVYSCLETISHTVHQRPNGDLHVSIRSYASEPGPGLNFALPNGYRAQGDRSKTIWGLQSAHLHLIGPDGEFWPVIKMAWEHLRIPLASRPIPKTWAISFPDHLGKIAMVYGDQNDFRFDGKATYLCRVPLSSGFRRWLWVRNKSGQPLPGAEVFADGNFLGMSDAKGDYLVQLKEPPSSLRVQFEGQAWDMREFTESGSPWIVAELSAQSGAELGPRLSAQD